MKLVRSDIFSFVLILIISSLFVWELFSFLGRPAAFDSNIHITNIAQFSQLIKEKEFPAIWINNIANYGLPVGIVAQQTTNYLGGLINLMINNPTATYNILIFIAVFLSNTFLYCFLRLYFSPLASFLGTFIFCFTPYRIFNIYVRGAMPEVFSGIFLPLILSTLYSMIVKRKFNALFLLILFIAGLTLTHPMMLVIYSFIFIPYSIFLLASFDSTKAIKVKVIIASTIAVMLGIMLSSYYILPLNMEIKYFYYGLTQNHLINNFLSFSNFFGVQWPYFTDTEIFTRGHIVVFGLIEVTILISGLIFIIYKKFIKKCKDSLSILYFALGTAGLIILFTTKYSEVFFQKLFFLNSIQFPWRFLSVLIFIPSIVAAFLYDRFPKKVILILVIAAVSYSSFPQLYGKNFSTYPANFYLFPKENPYSVQMNTIWTGKSEDYPDKDKQGEIIEGKGEIVAQTLKNSSRIYQIVAATPLRMVDRTFYFPGWNVYVDNVKTNIEFQDPAYRGVITYRIPVGQHTVKVVFEDTKVRAIAKSLSIVFLLITSVLFIGKRHIKKYVFGE